MQIEFEQRESETKDNKPIETGHFDKIKIKMRTIMERIKYSLKKAYFYIKGRFSNKQEAFPV